MGVPIGSSSAGSGHAAANRFDPPESPATRTRPTVSPGMLVEREILQIAEESEALAIAKTVLATPIDTGRRESAKVLDRAAHTERGPAEIQRAAALIAHDELDPAKTEMFRIRGKT